MENVLPCRRCGSAPYFKPYEQSNDGNHDIPASVTCLTCGRSTVMDWDLWFEVEEEVGDEKYAKPSAYLSARFMDALGDATIRKWNRENVGRPVTEHVCEITQDYPGIPYEHEDFSGTMERRERIVRCRDCVKCRPTTDGRRYCSLWSHIVPPEGYCWRGEEAEDAEA